jgi:hypothetical protein
VGAAGCGLLLEVQLPKSFSPQTSRLGEAVADDDLLVIRTYSLLSGYLDNL